MVAGPNARLVSNRVFNDTNVTSSPNGASRSGANVWGQFLDHTFGLREENGTAANIPFSTTDPLETSTTTSGRCHSSGRWPRRVPA